MKLLFFKGKHPNFGDELNPWLWPKLLPDFFDENNEKLFIGIGSIIGENFVENFPPHAKKIVFGAGYVPGYFIKPDVNRSDWNVYFVRGPRTARELNISPDLALGDSAILVRTLLQEARCLPEVVSFIPHWESMEFGNWKRVCQLAGVNLIDPRRPVDEVITEILRSRAVIAEAMHGAIVADALRVPWIPLLPINAVHREKWFDWADALEIKLSPYRLWPSSLSEAKMVFGRRTVLSALSHAARVSPFREPIEKAACHIAAQRLVYLAKASPCLSDDTVINRVTDQMLEKVDQLKQNYTK